MSVARFPLFCIIVLYFSLPFFPFDFVFSSLVLFLFRFVFLSPRHLCTPLETVFCELFPPLMYLWLLRLTVPHSSRDLPVSWPGPLFDPYCFLSSPLVRSA